MDDMKPDTAEPAPLADAMDRLLERFPHLADLVDSQDATQPALTTETPEEAQERQQRRLAAYAARWREKVPAMYQSAALADLDDLQHAVKVRGWLRSGGLHLVLAGPVGTGKTHAAYAVGNQALAAGLWVEAWSVGDLMDALRPGSGDHGADERARRCQVLILDDLTGKATDWEAERLTLLLDARVRDRRQTVVTTNITAAQIAETWGGRLMDRLRYQLTALTFTGESRRGADW